MVDDLEERLTRYRVDLDDAVTADLARRHREAGFNDADPLLLDTDHWIRLEPALSASVDRRRVKSVVVATLGVAAAVVAIVLVATRDDDVTPADQPSTTVTVPPTTPPRALLGSPELPVPGTYFVNEVDGKPTARIFFTIGAGWWIGYAKDTRIEPVGVGKSTISQDTPDVGLMFFSRPDVVFLDACHWRDGYHPAPMTTLDGLVAALSEQGGWADVTAPSDISIDGYVGKAFQRTVPAEIPDCSTARYSPRLGSGPGTLPAFRSWENEGGNLGGSFYEPGEIETVWVLDIDGTVVVVNTRAFPEVTAVGRAELANVLDSIRIERA